jgi:hypothetical protein
MSFRETAPVANDNNNNKMNISGKHIQFNESER